MLQIDTRKQDWRMLESQNQIPDTFLDLKIPPRKEDASMKERMYAHCSTVNKLHCVTSILLFTSSTVVYTCSKA